MPIGLGRNQIMLHECINLDFTSLGHRISCSHKCFLFGNWGYVDAKLYYKMWPCNCLCIVVVQQCWTKLYDDLKGGTCNGVCSP
jgi:hypothetical protein